MNKLLEKKWFLLICGAICGVVGILLAYFGNPKNMAICIACFIRDTAGAMKMHGAAPVQYVRPEVIGIVVGSFIIALITKEFKATISKAPVLRFILGAIMMIGALVFLGCPLRMLIRMSAGDANAYIALIGFLLGIGTGIIALKKGFSLGADNQGEAKATNGIAFPLLLIGLFVAFVAVPSLFAFSEAGPGSMHAPIAISLIGGLIFGIIAQKSRMCFAGSFKNIIIAKDLTLLSVIGGLFIAMLIGNIAMGNFHFSMSGQPIAHQEVLWNILGMYVVGLGAVLAGGCPLRQLVLAGQGSGDSFITVIGMFVGAAISHNFGLASSGDAVDEAGNVVLGGATTNGKIAVIICIVVLLLIGFVGNKTKKK